MCQNCHDDIDYEENHDLFPLGIGLALMVFCCCSLPVIVWLWG